jgi:hypothetical protein
LKFRFWDCTVPVNEESGGGELKRGKPPLMLQTVDALP